MAKELYAAIGTTDVLDSEKKRIAFLKSMAKIVKPIENCIVKLSCRVYEGFVIEQYFYYKFENGKWLILQNPK